MDAQFGRGAGPCGSGFGSLVSVGAARPRAANAAKRQPYSICECIVEVGRGDYGGERVGDRGDSQRKKSLSPAKTFN